ncbi:MAG: hypothetical protein EBS83_09545, partial [Planctomycetia bacterium]|nr:hypothetical protein [Planctomycetia bacterium]
GIQPEQGRSAITAAARAIAAMPLGRIDPVTTANIGTITGGSATNVVAEECTVTAECRSLDDEALDAQLMAMLDAFTWAATEGECDVEMVVRDHFTGYALDSADPQVVMARQALDDWLAVEPNATAGTLRARIVWALFNHNDFVTLR